VSDIKLSVYEVYNIQLFAFKIVLDDACHPIFLGIVMCMLCLDIYRSCCNQLFSFHFLCPTHLKGILLLFIWCHFKWSCDHWSSVCIMSWVNTNQNSFSAPKTTSFDGYSHFHFRLKILVTVWKQVQLYLNATDQSTDHWPVQFKWTHNHNRRLRR